MALENGTIRLPENRPPWGLKMDKYCTPKGIKALEEALRIFAPFSTGQLFADPALNLETRDRADSHIENAVQGFIPQTCVNFSNNGILTRDPIEIIYDINKAMTDKYPENAEFGQPFAEAFMLNEIKGRVQGYLLAMIGLREAEHRRKTSKIKPKGTRRGFTQPVHVPTHKFFFNLIDSHGSLIPPGTNIDAGSMKMLNDIRTNYLALRELTIPFLRGKWPFNNPGNKDKEELKAENDRIGRAILEKRKREIPLCTLGDDTILTDKPIVMQFGPLAADLHSFHSFLADVHLFDETIGKVVAESTEIQRLLSPQRTMVQDTGVQFGELPKFTVDRFNGELESFGSNHEALKLLAGNTPNYELIRKTILWYLAQLSCYQAEVEEIFGVHFERKRKIKPDHPRGPSPARDTSDSGGRSDKNYPVERVKRAIGETVESVHQRRTTPIGHTRLLPLIRKPDGGITICKPSKKARELAAKQQITLERGLEILDSEKIIYPERMENFLKSLGVSTIEEAIALDPQNIVPRHETWVDSRREDQETSTATKAIHAHVKKTCP